MSTPNNLTSSWFENVFKHVENSNYEQEATSFVTKNNTLTTGGASIPLPLLVQETWATVENASHGSFLSRNSSLTDKLRTLKSLTLSVLEDTDVFALIQNPTNANSVFFCSSNFSYLNTSRSSVTTPPSITSYAHNRNQGMSAALACPFSLWRRNYVPIASQNSLQLLMAKLSESKIPVPFVVENGVLLQQFTPILGTDSVEAYESYLNDFCKNTLNPMLPDMHKYIQVGVEYNTPVFDYNKNEENAHKVNLVFGGFNLDSEHTITLEPLTRAVLLAQYRILLAIGHKLVVNTSKRVKVFLTIVGGKQQRIRHLTSCAAIQEALSDFQNSPLDVYLVVRNNLPPLFRSLTKGSGVEAMSHLDTRNQPGILLHRDALSIHAASTQWMSFCSNTFK